MGKCKLCTRDIGEDSPFTNYCSSECERKAVGHYGEEKGIKKGLGFVSTIIIIIAGIAFFGIKECNSGKKQISKENQVTEIDSQNTTNQSKEEKYINDEGIISAEDTVNVKNETIINDIIVDSSNSRMVNYTNHQEQIKKATEMLNQDKSVSEIADTTSLTRKEIRQLRRKLRNEE